MQTAHRYEVSRFEHIYNKLIILGLRVILTRLQGKDLLQLRTVRTRVKVLDPVAWYLLSSLTKIPEARDFFNSVATNVLSVTLTQVFIPSILNFWQNAAMEKVI